MAKTTEAHDYRERAAEFERLAEQATNPDARELLLLIADRWITLAEDVESAGLLRSSAAGGSSRALH